VETALLFRAAYSGEAAIVDKSSANRRRDYSREFHGHLLRSARFNLSLWRNSKRLMRASKATFGLASSLTTGFG
jgi:hypothetical protein